MKIQCKLALVLIGFSPFSVCAATHYVWQGSPGSAPPYTNWATAATNIQQAVGAAAPGDVVVVTNGVYAGGVAVTNPLSLRSVNGPQFTVINGGGPCVSLTDGASLTGFTLTNGFSEDFLASGGGAYGGTLNNCILTGNCVYGGRGACGGGAAYATLNNCTVTGNSVWADPKGRAVGGGAYACTLNNCTLTGNSARWGGGAFGSTLNNCIVYFNSDSSPFGDSNYDLSSTLNYCCTTPMPTNGVGNITNAPLFVDYAAGNLRLQSNSPCINAGDNSYLTNSFFTNCFDLDGNPRLAGPFVDIGAYEYQSMAPVPILLTLQAAYTNLLQGFPATFTGYIGGHPTASWWDFGDGTVISYQLPTVAHSWAAPGDYVVALRAYNDSYPNGVSAAVSVHVVTQSVYYVSADSANPVLPYDSWATAATAIQDAIDAAVPAATVLVSNGVYATGGGAVDGTITGRLAVDRPLTVQSVNGPQVTVINGGGRNRCASLTDGASLCGFTLTNGATGDYGAGVWCESPTATVSNCVLVGNSAASGGGGAYGGTLCNCTLTSNSAPYGGGAFDGTLNNCTLTGNSASGGGGGAYGGALYNCTLTGNSAQWDGGGTRGTTLWNCTLTGNRAYDGGGAFDSTLNNCTLTGNSATEIGGGAYWSSTLNNCLAYLNSAPQGANYDPGTATITLNYCCTTPMPTNGVGNITNAPLFVDYANGNLRLQSNSPCINAGNNAYVVGSTDLDGNPRIVSGTVDIGAYEFQGTGSVISYAWLQQYGLPTDGSVDATDPDGDGLNNWQEWRCGTCPTNANSALRLLSAQPTGTNVTVTWQSVAGVNYFLECSTNLSATRGFTCVATNVPGQPGTTICTHTNAASVSRLFYRVGVGQ